jgi:hypothetical protein
MIRKIVAIAGLVGLFLGGMAALTSAPPCGGGSKGWKQICNLQGHDGDVRPIYDDAYLLGLRRAIGGGW